MRGGLSGLSPERIAACKARIALTLGMGAAAAALILGLDTLAAHLALSLNLIWLWRI